MISLPIGIEEGGKRYEGSFAVKGRNPAYIEVTCAPGPKTGSPGSVPHEGYAKIILREIVRKEVGRRASMG